MSSRLLRLLAVIVCVAPAALLAQNPRSAAARAITIPYDDQSSRAPYVIFSNLDPTPGAAFHTNAYANIAGRKAATVTESWAAIRFIPRVNVQATVLSAAVTYTSGTKLVDIGLYSNNEATGR